MPILLITPNTTYPSPLHKINRQIKNRACMYQVALEVCFRVPIKLMFDMHVHMINCNNAYTGSLTNLHADKHTNNTDPQGHGCKSSCINKTGPQWNQTWSCLDCINMELWSKSPGSWIRSISERNSGEKILYCDVDLVDTHENNILDIWVDTYSEYFILSLFDFNDWH